MSTIPFGRASLGNVADSGPDWSVGAESFGLNLKAFTLVAFAAPARVHGQMGFRRISWSATTGACGVEMGNR